MPKMLIESDTLENIADAIRDQTGENESYSPVDMPEAIRNIQGTSVSLTFDDTPTQGSNNPVKSGGIYNALSNKQQNLTQMPIVSSILSTDYLFIERNGTVYKVLASVLLDRSSESDSEALTGENGETILTESGDELVIDIEDETDSVEALH